jgi:transcriptional regulator NrdR family protein
MSKPHACPLCGGETGVLETRNGVNHIRRRRRCLANGCSGRLTTVEIEHPGVGKSDDLVVVPRDELERVMVLIQRILKSDSTL